MPLASEYEQAKAAGLALAHARATPHDADWLLYLGHVRRTAGMRVRRWVWHLCGNVRRAEVLFARRGDGALEAFVKETFPLARWKGGVIAPCGRSSQRGGCGLRIVV